MAISLHPYVLFGLLELLIVLVVLGSILTFKWRAAQRKAESLSKELHKIKDEAKKEIENTVVKQGGGSSEPLPVYADFLREQLEQSSILLGDDPQIQADQDAEDPSDVTRQMLAARHQFLQLELDVQTLSATRDVKAQRKSVVEGMQALLAGLVQHTEAQPQTDGAAADAAAEAPVSTSLSEEQKLRGQVDFLRNVVSNQHDVMHELRQLLEEHGGDSDELQAAMRKLGDAEKQGKELQRHLDAMENENARIKREAREKGKKQADAASPDSDMLRDLVGNQQRTIGNLQNLLRNLPSDSGKTKELDEVINKIQRTNNDLSSCVMVLEDENDHLREKVESLQKHIADLESPAVAAPESVAAAATAVDTDAVSAQVPATDVQDSDVDDVLEAASTPAPATVDLADGEDDIDALLDKVAADAKAKPAVAAEEKPAAVEPTQADSVETDDVDVDALLAASAPAAKPASEDLADDEDDIDALLDAAAAEAKAKPAEPEPATDVDPAEGVSADDDFDVDALLAASAPAAKPVSVDLAADEDDIDALLDAATADAKVKSAEPEPEPATDVDPTEGVSADDDFDVDALLAASAPAAKPASVDFAADEDDIDALLDKAAADAKAKSADPEPATDVDPTEGVSADDNFDVDALLEVSAPATKKDEKKSEPASTTTKPPTLTQGEAEQDDIDALLADLFSDDKKAGDGSKS